MEEPLEIEVEISSGKKKFRVEPENGAFNLVESGSIAAVVKFKDGKWTITTGSYSEEDARLIGDLIEEQSTAQK